MTSTKSMTLESPRRYHPIAASLHWIIALLIFTDLFLAFAPEGPGGLIPKAMFGLPIVGIHMLAGTLVLVLLVIRFFMRFSMKRPEPATAGHPILDVIGVLTHYSLYLFTFLMALSGLVMSIQRGYFAELWGIGSIPQTFNRASYTWGMIHGSSWSFLAFFILLHTGAAFYHQFIRRDHLLGRMWVGRTS